MMNLANQMQAFNHSEFGKVRTVLMEGEPWLVGKDVALALGYADPSSAVSKNVDSDDKTTLLLEQDGSNYKSRTTLVNESGLYALVLSSKLPTAKKFKRWVTSEVLPTIRKHGAYLTPEKLEEALLSPDTLIRLATQIKAEREARAKAEEEKARLEEKIRLDAPSTALGEAIARVEDDISVRDFAGILRQAGIDTGEKRLFKWLRAEGYLCVRGDSRNMPTQRALENGWIRTQEYVIRDACGAEKLCRVPRITGKGQRYFLSKFRRAA